MTDAAAEPIPVPPPDADFRTIEVFAMSYNGYERDGEQLPVLAIASRRQWDSDGTLPGSLPVARAVLFYEYRSWRFSSFDPEGDDEIYVRALLAHIRELGGGTVPGPPDIVP